MTTIEVVAAAEQQAAIIREQVPTAELPQFFGRAFGQIMAALQQQGVAPAAEPFALYFGMPGDTVDVAAGIPTAEAVAADGPVQPGVLPGGTVYRALHIGPYDSLESTYHALMEAMAADGARPAQLMWEHYLSDPQREPDPATWRTLVCWPTDA
jgi:AraC family transcriptional regulator